MAAPGLSKAEYLRRYLSGPAEPAQPRRRRKRKPPGGTGRGGMRIVDDDVSWNSIAAGPDKEEEEEDEGDMPVVAEFIDERPEEVKLMEEFRTNSKWKLLGDEDSQSSDISGPAKSATRRRHHGSPEPSASAGKHNGSVELCAPRGQQHGSPELSPPRRQRHDTPDPSPPRRQRHDTPDLSPPRRKRHDTPDSSPPRRQHHDTPDLSPPKRQRCDTPDLSPPRRRQRHDTPDPSPPRRQRHDTPDLSPPRRQQHDTPDLSPPRRRRPGTPDLSPPRRRQRHDTPEPSPPRRQRHDTPDLSPPRRQRHDTPDPSPPRRQRHDTPDLSPPRRQRHDTPDPSPPRRQRQDLSPRREKPGSPSGKKGRTKGRASPAQRDQPRSRSPPEPSLHHRDAKGSPKKAGTMASGVKAGLVSADVLQREKQELQKHERSTRHLEEESRNAQTVFRDKSGRKRNLAQEQLEQRLKAEAEAKREEQYAKWGKGLAQERQQQQNVEDAVKEMQKPLARYIDDQDLDRMLREQEREGDPMAALIKKRKAKENKEKEKPRYKGPAPPLNRFNIWPGHRWDGVDRSNGFEQQRFARIANKKAVQELAYKWSVEDM
ncbi:BUD13 homolog isoform X2 [Pyrgilauda ruficollis]|uniref:BUD13 homolog isoform X2 n=1 Tax=Pyrgilauda ruficollis TaxID=221976 RepID=UPI001B878B0A|nr:BUD13 homolog isoform X2 [Pyrgilauda ruficollis]